MRSRGVSSKTPLGIEGPTLFGSWSSIFRPRPKAGGALQAPKGWEDFHARYGRRGTQSELWCRVSTRVSRRGHETEEGDWANVRLFDLDTSATIRSKKTCAKAVTFEVAQGDRVIKR